MGVPVAKQQGYNDLNIVGARGLAGKMPPTPSQPFTVNATPITTIVNVGGNDEVVVEEIKVEAAFHCLLVGLRTQVLDSLPFLLFTILELEVKMVNLPLCHLWYILTSVPMRKREEV